MRRFVIPFLLGVTLAAVACGDDDGTGPATERFRATLNGANERPTARTTPGTSGVSNSLIAGFVTRATYTAPGAPNQGVTFDSLLALMRNGNSYVNVHTNNTANDPTNNTGPGDFPAGEIRGQVGPTP